MKIYIIGTGNVATRLGKAFLKAGHSIMGVAGRNAEEVSRLAVRLKSKSYLLPGKLPSDGDLYLIAVKDDAIAEMGRYLTGVKGIVVHTSGSTPLNIFTTKKHRGVFYPVTTIRKNAPADFKKVPVCIEATDEKTVSRLASLAADITDEIYFLNSEQRTALHLSAVFTNNFTNHLLSHAMQVLEKASLSPQLIHFLAKATIDNAFQFGPDQSQTGPAVRHDQKTIQKHLNLLQNNKDALALYRIFTRQLGKKKKS